jgi:hypothetical protein
MGFFCRQKNSELFSTIYKLKQEHNTYVSKFNKMANKVVNVDIVAKKHQEEIDIKNQRIKDLETSHKHQCKIIDLLSKENQLKTSKQKKAEKYNEQKNEEIQKRFRAKAGEEAITIKLGDTSDESNEDEVLPVPVKKDKLPDPAMLQYIFNLPQCSSNVSLKEKVDLSFRPGGP